MGVDDVNISKDEELGDELFLKVSEILEKNRLKKITGDIETYFSPWWRCSTKAGYQFKLSLSLQLHQIELHLMVTPSKKKIRGLEGITHSIFWKKLELLKIGWKMHFFTNVSKNAVKSGQNLESPRYRLISSLQKLHVTLRCHTFRKCMLTWTYLNRRI